MSTVDAPIVQSVLKGAVGGAVLGSAVGLIEAIWLSQIAPAPESRSVIYAVFLYGIIGSCIGDCLGLAVHLVGSKIAKLKNREAGIGAAAAAACMGGFVLLYQVRKVYFAEQMPSALALLGIAVSIGFVCLACLYFDRWLRPGKATAGAGLAFILTGVVFSLTGGNAADSVSVSHGKTIPAELKDKPNVLLLFVDTLRADHVGSYGKMEISTPAMDGLAKDGILYERCISQSSWTRPSGVSIFSGRLPSGHSTQRKSDRAPDGATLVSETLRDAGVTTGALVNNINMTATFNFDQGFDSFFYASPNYPFGGTESVFGLTFYKVLIKVIERLGLSKNKKVNAYYQPADVVFEQSKAFIQANSDSRWFLYAHLMEPHDPYFEHPSLLDESGEEYNGKGYGRAEHERPDLSEADHLKKLYKGEVEFMDGKIGAFLEWMRSEGIYEDTLILLISDHGEEFGEHGGFWHGTTLYEEVLHVPLIIKTPRSGPKGLRVPWQVRSMDVAPTIADALKLKADSSWEGESLLRAQDLAHAEGAENRVVEETLEYSDPAQACEAKRKHSLDRIAVAENNFEGNILSSIQNSGFKYIVANPDNNRQLKPKELYDLENDATEARSLIGEGEVCGQANDKRAEKMHQELGTVLNAARESAAVSEGAALDDATMQQLRQLGYMK